MTRSILEALRVSRRPMTSQELAQRLVAQRGLNAADKALVKTMGKRVGASLRDDRGTGLARSEPRPNGAISVTDRRQPKYLKNMN